MVANLPPGDYILEFENGGLTRTLTHRITVVAGQPQIVSLTMPGFDGDRLVETLLGQD